MGLNTQDSSLDLAQGFALVANNCVIDQYGRIGARQGWLPQHTTLAALGTASVKAIGQLVVDDGSEYVVAAGNNKLFKLAGGALSELTYGGGGTAPTITDSNWQIVSLNQCIYFFQSGHNPLVFQPSVSATTYRRVSEMAGYTGTVLNANVALSAYGRLWVASTTTDKTVVAFSDILAGQVWTAGTSGTLDVSTVWPNGSDTITGLAAHNGFLFIFGKTQFLYIQELQHQHPLFCLIPLLVLVVLQETQFKTPALMLSSCQIRVYAAFFVPFKRRVLLSGFKQECA